MTFLSFQFVRNNGRLTIDKNNKTRYSINFNMICPYLLQWCIAMQNAL